MRLSEDDKNATYQVFRQWLGPDGVISEEDWKTLMEEDEAFDYENRGVGREEENNRQPENIETEIITGGHMPCDSEGHDD